MLNISFSFGLRSGAYNTPLLSLTGASHDLGIEFKRGDHVFTSPDMELGTIHALRDAPLMGRLIFRYTCNELDGVDRLTICNEDFESADGMALVTFPLGREEASCLERASGAGFAADEIHHNGVWNTRSPLLPGVSQLLRDLARDATRAMISALAEHDDVLLRIRTPFPQLPLEDYKKMCFVIRDGKPLCPYDELSDERLSAEKGAFEVWDLFSRYNGTEQVAPGTTFANVIGSSNDPRPKGAASWLLLWNAAMRREARVCATLGDPPSVTGCVPGARLVGGHIIQEAHARTVDPGSDEVSIIPICYAHNNTNFMDAMRAKEEHWVVRLTKYQEK